MTQPPADSGPALTGTFSIDIELHVAVTDVFSAYSKLEKRTKWFRLPGIPDGAHVLDFRVGGHESVAVIFSPMGDKPEHLAYDSQFVEIVEGKRIVFDYTFKVNGRSQWTSTVTIDLTSDDEITRLRHTERYSFHVANDGGVDGITHLKGATRLQLNGLVAVLRGE